MNSKTNTILAACLLWGAATRAELPATLTTTDGQTYTGVSLIRAEPDGYLVNYQPVKNGVGIAKIKFSRLTADQQKEAGYDAGKAHEFETRTAQGAENWREENLRWEQAAKADRQVQQAREDQEEQMAIARMTALAEIKQAEAEASRSSGNSDGYDWASLGGGFGAIAIPVIETDRRGRNRDERRDGINERRAVAGGFQSQGGRTHAR